MAARHFADCVVDSNEASAALSIPEESAAPVHAIVTASVATVDETIVQQLKILLTALLVARQCSISLDFLVSVNFPLFNVVFCNERS